MNDIIKSTSKFLTYLDNSDLIKNLTKYKEKSLKNKNIINLVKKYHQTLDNNELINIKKELYTYQEYVNYQKYYEELSFLILKINQKYSKYLNTKRCHYE